MNGIVIAGLAPGDLPGRTRMNLESLIAGMLLIRVQPGDVAPEPFADRAVRPMIEGQILAVGVERVPEIGDVFGHVMVVFN